MELKEFVKTTLLDIEAAINEAQSESKSSMEINPTVIKNDNYSFSISHHRNVHNVEFDVAVTSTGKIEGSAKAGIEVLGFGAGGKVTDEKSNASRIKFEIPVVYPNSN